MIKYFLIFLFSFFFVVPVYAGTGLNVSEGYINFNGVNGGLSVDSIPIFQASQSNIGIGKDALRFNITGSNNIALGSFAGYYNLSATSTTAIGANAGRGTANFNAKGGVYLGYQAGYSAGTGGDYNTLLGYEAGYNTSTGDNALYAGYRAGYYATSTSFSTYLGYQAGRGNTGTHQMGDYNTVVGSQALMVNTTGEQNSAMGVYSMFSNTTGKYNSAIGVNSLYANTTGSSNMAIGYASISSNTTGTGNMGIGVNALQYSITGSNNVAIGTQASRYNTSATSTVAIGINAAIGTANYNAKGGVYLGYQAGYSASTGGDYNTMLGYQSGYNVSTGKYNIILGQNVDATSTSSTGGLNIGNAIFGSGLYTGSTVSNTAMTNVKIGIGTSSPSEALSVSGKVLADAYLEYSPIYVGDALSSLKSFRAEASSVKAGSNWASVDHASLPDGIRYEKEIYVPPVYATTTVIVKGEEGFPDEVVVVEDRKKVVKEGYYYTFVGRDLGKQVQFNVRAIQQLLDRIEVLENRVRLLELNR